MQLRTFKGWDDHRQPGWHEINLVADGGGRLEGRFLWILVTSDVATVWSECLPVIRLDGASVLVAVQRLRQHFPIPLRGIDAVDDPAVMNALLEQGCDAPVQGLVLTGSDARQSGDQRWGEQGNGMRIRRVVGCELIPGQESAQLLAELCAALRLFTNLFRPSLKLGSGVREGGWIKRQHHPLQKPLQQPLLTAVLSEPEGQDLRELRKP